MKRIALIFALTAMRVASPAFAQSFNIDMCNNFGTPPSAFVGPLSYGAASGQTGY